MKRFLSLILCTALVLFAALCSACTGNGHSPAPDEGESAQVGETDTENGDEKVIRLVTDLGRNANFITGAEDDTDIVQYALDHALDYLGGLPDGYRVEVEVLPLDEADFQSRLTRLRAEIMAGQGPDIYVLSTDDLFWMESQDRLFPDPQKAMTDGYFLQLDDYVENAQFMKLEEMNPVVMDAGCTPEGRFLLPLRYTFGFAWINEPVTDTGGSWDDVVQGDDETLAMGYAEAAYMHLHSIFKDTVDHKTRSLLFSEEELYESIAETLRLAGIWRESIRRDTIGGTWVNVFSLLGGENNLGYIWGADTKDTAAYIPLRNKEGGVPARVTGYVAVNRNTPYPEEAFHVVDVIMSEEFQSGETFWEVPEGYKGGRSAIAVLSWSTGVPVYNDLMSESRPVNYERYIEDEMFPVYCEMRDKITEARIMNTVDRAIDHTYLRAWIDGMTPGEELKKFVSQQYNKMVLMAGEM